MSAAATAFVISRSPYQGPPFAVHLMIADVVNDTCGNEFWMSTRRLAAKARCSPSSATRALDLLQRDGFLDQMEAPDPALCKPGRYRFLFPEIPVVFAESPVPPARPPSTLLHPGAPPCSTLEHPAPPWSTKNSRRTQESKDTSVPSEPRASAARVYGVQEAIGHFVDECNSQGKPSLLLKRRVLGSHVKRALAAGANPAHVTEAVTQAVRESRPLRFLELLRSIENRESAKAEAAKVQAARDLAAAAARRSVEALFGTGSPDGRNGMVESAGDILGRLGKGSE